MTLRHWTILTVTAGWLLAAPAPARAIELTGFVGLNLAPKTQTLWGASADIKILTVVRAELELANSGQKAADGTPGTTTALASGMLRIPVGKWFVYATVGVGGFRQVLGTETATGMATSFGGGVQVKLSGIVGARLDYRVITLGSASSQASLRQHRVYIGLHLTL